MRFKVKDMDIATGGPLVAILHKNDALRLDLHNGDRIAIKDHPKEIICLLDIAQNEKAVPEGSIGLFEEVLTQLRVTKGNMVRVRYAGKPESLEYIRKKLFGTKLSYKELFAIIDDITHDRLSDIEKTYFVSAGFVHGWDLRETVDMTKAMVDTGEKLHFGKPTLDKHCIGGLPGNRTTMIVIPIIAAAGYTIPKTSSRAITSPAGTADTMECLAKVMLSEKKIKQVVKKTGACIVHGGAMNLAPADDKIITVEHPLSIDAEGQMLASVMAKKYSVGSSHVLIDIPMGKTAKVKTRAEAEHLKKMFTAVGERLGMTMRVIITDGSQPIGYGVGPLLEANDVMSVLRNEPAAPQDLRSKALFMAAQLLQMVCKCSMSQAFTRVSEILVSGKAHVKMQEMIRAQGVQKPMKLGSFTIDVRSVRAGVVKEIDNEIIARVARVAGAPLDKGAGVYVHVRNGVRVSKGTVLYTVYSESESHRDLANDVLKESIGYRVV